MFQYHHDIVLFFQKIDLNRVIMTKNGDDSPTWQKMTTTQPSIHIQGLTASLLHRYSASCCSTLYPSREVGRKSTEANAF